MNISTRRSIEFEKIRNGTVFKHNGYTYIKGEGKYAISLESGDITEVKDGTWNDCTIYPGASLRLG